MPQGSAPQKVVDGGASEPQGSRVVVHCRRCGGRQWWLGRASKTPRKKFRGGGEGREGEKEGEAKRCEYGVASVDSVERQGAWPPSTVDSWVQNVKGTRDQKKATDVG